MALALGIVKNTIRHPVLGHMFDPRGFKQVSESRSLINWRGKPGKTAARHYDPDNELRRSKRDTN